MQTDIASVLLRVKFNIIMFYTCVYRTMYTGSPSRACTDCHILWLCTRDEPSAFTVSCVKVFPSFWFFYSFVKFGFCAHESELDRRHTQCRVVLCCFDTTPPNGTDKATTATTAVTQKDSRCVFFSMRSAICLLLLVCVCCFTSSNSIMFLHKHTVCRRSFSKDSLSQNCIRRKRADST